MFIDSWVLERSKSSYMRGKSISNSRCKCKGYYSFASHFNLSSHDSGYEASVQTRYFEGVQGSKSHQGELFGLKNIFRRVSSIASMKGICLIY
jgi:hypothetical protein